ncbi:PKD domain-containing protein [Actinospica durhamensis]|uniref:PKD domain-containing protein n=1 Tax=Actinospica durhamensis TaxID=1508375 RepID=UPI0027DCD2E6|nr:PKD domain-containing protein [Actinospica durhamensis]
MRKRHIAVLVALCAAVAGPVPSPAYASSTPTTYFVDNSDPSACSDTGPGSQIEPFCTVQTAADAASVPGDTVEVMPGSYLEQVDISASGTPSAPITFETGASIGRLRGAVITSGSDWHSGFVLSGASNIVIDGFTVAEVRSGIVIDDSSDVTVDRVIAGSGSADNAPIQVNGTSSHVTLSRDEAEGGWHTPGIAIDASGSGDVVTSDFVSSETGDGGGISVMGSSGAVITGNTVVEQCAPGISIGDDANGTASGATIENNVVGPNMSGCTSPGAGIVVGSTADTAGAVLDYNDVYPGTGVDAYTWAGANYATAAALNAATGQGAADLNADPELEPGAGQIMSPTSPLISSANSDAPGELPTDASGAPRTCAPGVTESGVGHSACYDRGAYQYLDTVTLSGGSEPTTPVPIGTSLTANAGTASSSWGSATFDYAFDFGDGTVVDGAAPTAIHTYTKPGTYTLTEKVTSSFGGSSSSRARFVISPDVPFTYQLSTSASGTQAISAVATITSAWQLTDATIAFGDGYSAPAANGAVVHTYAKPGTYPVTLTVDNVNGDHGSVTQQFTTQGSAYTPVGPVRLLDTRHGTGAPEVKVAVNHSVALKIAGNGSIPSDATAVALNVTVTDTAGNGYISVTPSGASASVSNLNYLAGQTVTNYVIVPVGSDGQIELHDAGPAGGSVDLIADVSGYFTHTAGDDYSPVGPARVLDTRHNVGVPTGKVAPDHGISVGALGIPAGAIAVAVHVTVTDTTGNGWIAAEPDGAGTPTTSILNYLKGQTVSNTVIVPVAADGKIELYNGGGTGSVDLIGDVAGYFSAGSTEAYMPVAPYRSWDSRKNGTALTAGGDTSYDLAVDQDTSGVQQFPDSATLITNITVTDVTANGYLIAYGASSVRPGVSNLNYLEGQTVAGMSLLATSGPAQQIDIRNQSSGTGDVILDVFGYFAS